MDLAEAVAELGIGLDASPDQTRRAYLRLLKTRKPETDPQGFMRLREAFDLAKQHAEMQATLGRIMAGQLQEVEAAARPFREPPPPAPEPGPPVVEEPPRSEEADRNLDAEPPRSEDADRNLDAEPPRSEDADRTVDPEPSRSEDAHRTVDPEPSRSEDADHGREEPEDAPNEAPAAPRPAPEPPIEEPPAEEEERPPSMAVVEQLLESGDRAAAAREMARVFDAAAHDVVGPAPPLFKAIHLLFVLNGDDEVDAARALRDGVAGWLRVSGQEARLLRGDAAVRWAVARELSSLPRKLSSTVRVAIAHAALANDLAQAKRDLFAFRQRRPAAAEDAARMLRKKAPTLAAAYADSLDAPTEPARPVAPSGGGGGFRGVWAILVVALGLIRVFAATSSSRSSYDSSQWDPARFAGRYQPPVVFDAGSLNPPLVAVALELKARALRRADRMLQHLNPPADAGLAKKRTGDAKARVAVSELADQLEREDCTAARASARDLRMRFVPDAGKAKDEIGRVEALTLEGAVIAYCDALDKSRRRPSESATP